MKKGIFYVSLLLVIILMMTATTVMAAPENVLKNKKTPPGLGQQSTEVTPAPRGNSEQHRNDQSNAAGKKTNFRGVVVASSDTSLTVELKDGTQQVIALDGNTVIKYPTHFIPQATETATATAEATDVPTETSTATETAVVTGPLDGLQVMVHAVKQADESYLALTVMVIPGKPVKLHHVGEVTAYTEGVSITIKGKDGKETTFDISDMTKILPDGSKIAVGDTVTVIMPRVLNGQPMVAAGIVLHTTTMGTDTESTSEPAD